MAADTDPVFFSRAAWRAPLLLYILRTRLLETRDPGPPTLGLHLRMFLTAGLVDLSLSRDEILRAYVGRACFGRGRLGAEAAARGYFATELSRATEAQILALAPLQASPQSLENAPETHRTRVALVPTRRVNAGLIDATEADRLAALPPAQARPDLRCSPPES